MKHALFYRGFASSRLLCISLWLVPGFMALCTPEKVQANVYATDIRLNGGTNNVAIGPGGSVIINYVLNQDATAGVTIKINSSVTTWRTISLAGGSPGTLLGAHSVMWDGKDDNTNQVVSGTYSVQIVAAANDLGGGDWQPIGSPAYVAAPRGIAVNRNTNSFYYGRVFVSNGTNIYGGSSSGDLVGIQKFNADGSAGDEGGFSDGGWPWAGDGSSPWKMEVAPDDSVYVGDFNLTSGGAVVRFDQTISSNSQLAVLRNDNWPNGGAVRLSGPFITGKGTNTQIWMADTNVSGVGIRRWNVTGSGAAATNNTGTPIVLAGTNSMLDQAPFDLAVDASNRIYTIQSVLDFSDLSYRVFRFPAYTNAPKTNADWRIGSSDDTMLGATGIAVDPTATFVAVAFQGSGNGGIRIFNTANGGDVTTLTIGSPAHAHTDVAWDNVGNLYACDNDGSVWRAYSPPGTNSAITVALESVQVTGVPPVRPRLSNPSFNTNQFNFMLLGQANVTYIIQVATNLPANSWLPVLTNTAPAATRPLTVPALTGQGNYRAVVAP